MDASRAVEVRGVEKTFVKRRSLRDVATRPFARALRVAALRGIDLDLAAGELLALLGPNGAGKTTLLKILSGLVLPDRGTARIAGLDAGRERQAKARIGLVHCDERSFYWRLSARENLRFFASLYDLPRGRAAGRIDDLLRRVDLAGVRDRRFAEFSSGMKQRMAIARALLHDPPILLMDEPTRSLDPVAAAELRAFVRNELQRRDGKTVLLATHNLHEAEALADRVAVLARGRIREVGTVEAVRRFGLNEQRFVVVTEPEPPAPRGPFRLLADERRDGRRLLTIALEPGTRLDETLRVLLAAGLPIHACDRQEPDLEEAFARILAAEPADA